MDKLRENMTTRQEIESSLVKDLNLIDNKYKNMLNDLANAECKFKEAQIRNKNLEKALQDAGNTNERKVLELNMKLELLEKEKDRVLSEKCSKIQVQFPNTSRNYTFTGIELLNGCIEIYRNSTVLVKY